MRFESETFISPPDVKSDSLLASFDSWTELINNVVKIVLATHTKQHDKQLKQTG